MVIFNHMLLCINSISLPYWIDLMSSILADWSNSFLCGDWSELSIILYSLSSALKKAVVAKHKWEHPRKSLDYTKVVNCVVVLFSTLPIVNNLFARHWVFLVQDLYLSLGVYDNLLSISDTILSTPDICLILGPNSSRMSRHHITHFPNSLTIVVMYWLVVVILIV